MIVRTASGTSYEFDSTREMVRRVGGGPMRRDEDWLAFQWETYPEIGQPMVLALEPLGEGNVTIRTTNLVVSIDDE